MTRDLSDGRGAIFDRRNSRRLRPHDMFPVRALTPGHLRIAHLEGINGKIGARGHGLQYRRFKVASLHRVGLCGILSSHQIVGDRDDREENDDEQKQSNELNSPMRASVTALRLEAQPEADEAQRHQGADEIENQFQDCFLF